MRGPSFVAHYQSREVNSEDQANRADGSTVGIRRKRVLAGPNGKVLFKMRR